MIRKLNQQQRYRCEQKPFDLPKEIEGHLLAGYNDGDGYTKTSLKKGVRAASNLIAFILSRSIRQILANFSKGIYRSSGKENRCLGRFPLIKKFRKFW